MFDEFGINAGYVEELHTRWLQSPHSVEEDWRRFFEGTDAAPSSIGASPFAAKNGRGTPHVNGNGNGTGNGNGNGATAAAAAAVAAVARAPATAVAYREAVRESVIAATELQSRVAHLVNAYRVRGHLFANVDPLDNPPAAAPELELSHFGLSEADLDKTFSTAGMAGLPERARLGEIVTHLSETYCSSIGVEYTHIEEPEPRLWLQQQMESTRNRALLDRPELLRILTKLTEAEIFEQFIHKNYVGAKRFSLEGSESMIPLIDLLVEAAGQHGIEELVIGMAHRGRLNVLVNVMGKNVREIFAAFDDKKPERFLGAGDVKYHLGYSSEVTTQGGRQVHLSMAFNPSHLEFVNPVVEGRVRAKIDRRKRKSTMPLLVHGDAAFMGEGIVAETLNFAGLEGYTTGGTIHLVINNQIGFTTVPSDSRSTRYCTDITRMLRVPVFHVNGEDPQAVIQVTRLAIEFRQRFKQDVVIDMYCYRKYGHNEGDEPRFTQPLMYALIDKKPTVREVYVARLVAAGQVSAKRPTRSRRSAARRSSARSRRRERATSSRSRRRWAGSGRPTSAARTRRCPRPPTAFPKEKLLDALEKLTTMPAGFHANPKALKILEQRRERASAGHALDWGTAEHLAFASILLEGHGIRISGQDARRGTFSHRHAVLFDTETGEPYTPLASLGHSSYGGVGRFEIYDSPLSEAGVLGFEYGYSLDRPDKLVVWEAQFGDFANAAQVIIDQFIVSAEDKWSRLSGLVLLLPHGFEGQGPEHSSARIERFLQLAAEDNIQVCNLTTPAQLFHVLRRQVNRPWRKPLVIFTPKSLLRHPEAVNKLEEIADGRFQRVIPDDTVDPARVKRILLCSGKVYYDLAAERRRRKRDDVAIVRLEQYYPLSGALAKALAGFPRRHAGRLGAGGAAQHGRVVLPQRAKGRDLRRSPPAGAHLAAREREPGDGQQGGARSRAEDLAGRGVRGLIDLLERWGFAALGAALVLVAALINRFAPAKRGRIRRAVVLYVLFLALAGTEQLLVQCPSPSIASWAEHVHLVGGLFAAFTSVELAGLLVFDLLLPALGVSVLTITSDLVVGFAYVFAAFGVLKAAGVSASSVVTTSAVVSGVLALSLQATLGNILGGVALQLDGSIHVGDWLQLPDGPQGKVSAIRWRHTVVETRNWDTIIVPNANLLAQNIIILGKRTGKPLQHRMWVYFNVDFRYPPSRVIDVVGDALQSSPIEGVAERPEAQRHLLRLREGRPRQLRLLRRPLLAHRLGQRRPTSSRVRTRIYTALQRAGHPARAPAQTLFVTPEEPEGERGQATPRASPCTPSRASSSSARSPPKSAQLAGRAPAVRALRGGRDRHPAGRRRPLALHPVHGQGRGPPARRRGRR